MAGYRTVLNTELPGLKIFKKGKVREVYELNNKSHLLMVATDRISAYDSVLPRGIPYKGTVLTLISVFWFRETASIVENHLIEHNFAKFPAELEPHRELLENRSMLVKKVKPYPVECIVRGYITGSGWAEYVKTGTVCSIKLPAHLKESEKLPEPIFTPSTKASSGHDINISFEEAAGIVGENTARKLKNVSLDLYRYVSGIAEKKGIIIADTKFEFGELNGTTYLIDEIFTPDSSRFWEIEHYEPGKPQKSLDKQFVRDYLNSINWDRQPPAPDLPDEIVQTTSRKYLEVYKKLTGMEIS